MTEGLANFILWWIAVKVSLPTASPILLARRDHGGQANQCLFRRLAATG